MPTQTTDRAVDATSQWQHSLQDFANTALKSAAAFWFVVAVLGQLVFAFYIAAFYGSTAMRGDLPAWNKVMLHGYVPGDRAGNLVIAVHLVSAVIILLSGAMQLVPRIRRRAPILHRWNGRLYLVTAFTISIAGLYMIWVRGTIGDLSQHLGSSLMVVLIMLCAAMTLRSALARDFKTHRRWALRLFLIVGASLFTRAGLMLSLLLFRGPVGYDPLTLKGPFLTFLSFAQYLLPLAVLEVYLRTQARSAALGRITMAAGLLILTVAMGAGIFAAAMGLWLPVIRGADRSSWTHDLSIAVSRVSRRE